MRYLVLALLIAGFFTSGCKSNPQPTTTTLDSQGQPTLRLSVLINPTQPRMDKPFTVRAQVFDPQGAPVTGVKIVGTLTMKTMDHGKNEFEFTEKGHGVYEGISKVEMSGEWELQLKAQSGSNSAVQSFPVTIAD